jgi:hypothetical protein
MHKLISIRFNLHSEINIIGIFFQYWMVKQTMSVVTKHFHLIRTPINITKIIAFNNSQKCTIWYSIFTCIPEQQASVNVDECCYQRIMRDNGQGKTICSCNGFQRPWILRVIITCIIVIRHGSDIDSPFVTRSNSWYFMRIYVLQSSVILLVFIWIFIFFNFSLCFIGLAIYVIFLHFTGWNW